MGGSSSASISGALLAPLETACEVEQGTQIRRASSQLRERQSHRDRYAESQKVDLVESPKVWWAEGSLCSQRKTLTKAVQLETMQFLHACLQLGHWPCMLLSLGVAVLEDRPFFKRSSFSQLKKPLGAKKRGNQVRQFSFAACFATSSKDRNQPLVYSLPRLPIGLYKPALGDLGCQTIIAHGYFASC